MSSPPRRTLLRLPLRLAALIALASLHVGGAAALPTSSVLEMQLVDRDSGAPLAQYPSRGRQFSPGAPGARYAVRLSNRSDARVLVVLSVDGINAITGKTAAWHQSGYVLMPGESVDITGWRKSDQHVAAFEFTSLGDSYAARTGRPANVGVVGAAVFREAVAVPQVQAESVVAAPAMPAPRLMDRLADATPAGRAEPSRAAAAKLGTGHGASEWSPLQHTTFQRRGSRPDQMLEIHYDSQANLVAAGVMPRSWASLPRSFPNGEGGYVPDPPARW